MIAEEEKDKDAKEGSQCHDYNRYYLAVSKLLRLCTCVHVLWNVDGSEYDSIAYAKEHGPEEKEEVFIISLSNARSDPWAMMV